MDFRKSLVKYIFAILPLLFAGTARAQWDIETIEVNASVWNSVMSATGMGGGGGDLRQGGFVQAGNPDYRPIVEIYNVYNVTCSSPFADLGASATESQRQVALQYANSTIPIGMRAWMQFWGLEAMITYRDASYEKFIPNVNSDAPTPTQWRPNPFPLPLQPCG